MTVIVNFLESDPSSPGGAGRFVAPFDNLSQVLVHQSILLYGVMFCVVIYVML